MNFNLLYLSVSTLHSSSLWRTDAIALAKLNKPPLSNMPPVSISPFSNALRHLNFTFPLVTHAFSTTSLRVHFKLSLTPVGIFGFSILQDSVFSRSVTFLPRNKLFPSFKNSCLVLKRGQLQNLSCENELKTLRKPHIGPLNSVTIREDRIEWVKHSRLLGVTIDERLSWSRHLPDIKKNFVNKLNLLKRSSFLSRNALLDLYFKIILPSVLYGLIVWGGCPNADLLHSLEVLHRWAARIIYNLPRDMPTEEVYRHSNWNTLTLYYKLRQDFD